MPTTSWEQPWKTLYINKEIWHLVFPKAGLNLIKQWLIFFLAIFCLFFFSSFPFHQLLSSQERNFWTINLSYTHTLFYFLFLVLSLSFVMETHGKYLCHLDTQCICFSISTQYWNEGVMISRAKAVLLSFPKQHI